MPRIDVDHTDGAEIDRLRYRVSGRALVRERTPQRGQRLGVAAQRVERQRQMHEHAVGAGILGLLEIRQSGLPQLHRPGVITAIVGRLTGRDRIRGRRRG